MENCDLTEEIAISFRRAQPMCRPKKQHNYAERHVGRSLRVRVKTKEADEKW